VLTLDSRHGSLSVVEPSEVRSEPPPCAGVLACATIRGTSERGTMKRPPAKYHTPACPAASCHAHMEKRSGKNGAFWGCARYPHCTGTRPIDWTSGLAVDRTGAQLFGIDGRQRFPVDAALLERRGRGWEYLRDEQREDRAERP